MFKEYISALIIALAIVASAFIVRPVPQGPFQAAGFDGVFYRLNQNTGRLDVLVPTSEGALMMPVGQIAAPKDQMNEEEKKQFSGFLKAVAQYVQIERAKSLGLKIEPAKTEEAKK